MSVYSNRSSSSKTSKRIAKKTEVDESLFGKIYHRIISSNKLGNKPNTANAIRDPVEVQKITQEIRKGELTNPNAVLIPKSELQRMKVM